MRSTSACNTPVVSQHHGKTSAISTLTAEEQLTAWVTRYYRDPVAFVEEVLGVVPDENGIGGLEDYQRGILNAAADPRNRRISVRSGHGVGKTATLAWLIVWHMCTRFPQKTVCTAPTKNQLYDALASETKGWMRMLPRDVLALFDIQVEHIFLRSAPEKSYASFRVSKPETPEALAGIHSDNVLLICDEASGIPEAVYEAAAGSMSGHNALTVLAGNPIRGSGLFFDSHNELADMWRTFHVNCHDSTRCTPDFFEDMSRRYGGPGSNEYRVRVLGEFPLVDDDTIISSELANTALLRDVDPIWEKPIWGVDVARKGSDRSALAKRKGNVLLEPVKSWKNLDTMELAARVKEEWDNTLPSERPEEICIDAIGIGAGVADRLTHLNIPARSINVSESPAMTERYSRLKDELWWTAKTWFEKRNVNICNDTKLMKELVVVKGKLNESTGKFECEKKAETKKRTKNISPDLADAFILTFAGTAVSLLHGSSNSTSWNKPLRREGLGVA